MTDLSFDTVWPADSVEFCPHPDALNVLACGTYRLEQSESQNSADSDEAAPAPLPQKRRGKCILFAFEDENTFSQIHETSLPAVLDMKWCHGVQSETPILAIADSEGNITMHEYLIGERSLKKNQTIPCADSDVLCLSLDWSNRRNPSSALGSLIVSLSNGSLALLQPANSSGLTIVDTWHAHDYEPWIAAWNYWDTNIVYSGGDDLKMKGWDIRQGFSEPTFVNKRFDAGVTSIQSHPYVEHLIAVGSYDNTVRLFDTRKILKPLTEVDVGGGAWRVKWHPSAERKSDLLVACMHDGCKIVRFSPSDELVGAEAEVRQRFDKHESMAYGADWSFAPSTTADTTVASCSFYDHLMQVWRG